MLVFCFRCVRFIVRSAGKSIQSSLLAPVAATITSIFAEEPHGCFLYLGSVMVGKKFEIHMLIFV